MEVRYITDLLHAYNTTGHSGAPDPLLGDILVVIAQLVAATQMVVEEKFIGKYNVRKTPFVCGFFICCDL